MQNSTWPCSNHFQPIVDIQTLPEFTIGNITKYFITRITSDGKSANDFKNFDNSGFPLFKDGHVQNICAHISTNFTYYVADCLPEMKKTIPYTIKLIIDNNSADVEYATCKCPAGGLFPLCQFPLCQFPLCQFPLCQFPLRQFPFGQLPTLSIPILSIPIWSMLTKGSCKHIAAMCYALEDFTRERRLREHVSCTSQLQTWNQPWKRNLDTVNVSDIKFVKMEYGKQKRLSSVAPYDPRLLSLQHTSVKEVQFLRNALQLKGDAALLYMSFQTQQQYHPTCKSVISFYQFQEHHKIVFNVFSGSK